MRLLTSSILSELAWLEHGFATREAIEQDPPLTQEGTASLKQIHSNLILRADAPGGWDAGYGIGCVGEADALVTDRAGVALTIRTADCLPILIADSRTRAVAAVHAGWRGTAGSIVAEAVRRLAAEYGSVPHDLSAAIGPGIGDCCYEVGAKVARHFRHTRPNAAGRFQLNLAAENRDQLIAAGVSTERIEQVGGCTCCQPELFYSYRRDGERAGRMIALIRQKSPLQG